MNIANKIMCRFCGGYLRTEMSNTYRSCGPEDVCYDCKIPWEQVKERGQEGLLYLIEKIIRKES